MVSLLFAGALFAVGLVLFVYSSQQVCTYSLDLLRVFDNK